MHRIKPRVLEILHGARQRTRRASILFLRRVLIPMERRCSSTSRCQIRQDPQALITLHRAPRTSRNEVFCCVSILHRRIRTAFHGRCRSGHRTMKELAPPDGRAVTTTAGVSIHTICIRMTAGQLTGYTFSVLRWLMNLISECDTIRKVLFLQMEWWKGCKEVPSAIPRLNSSPKTILLALYRERPVGMAYVASTQPILIGWIVGGRWPAIISSHPSQTILVTPKETIP